MGKLLKTKELAGQIEAEIKGDVRHLKERGIYPAISVLLVKGDPASAYYAKAKEKLARKLGIRFLLTSFHQSVTERELLEKINGLNHCPSVHGIMLELPLPKHLDANKLSSAVSPEKDVDGLTPSNQFSCMNGTRGLYPATPQSCIRILKYFGYSLKGKRVVLIGHGKTVGRPLVHMLLRENATLTVCDEFTTKLKPHIDQADILISAVGKANLIMPEMVHPELVIIDAGINDTPDGITGDVNAEVAESIRAMTPVPGGVGKITTMVLFQNLIRAVSLQTNESVVGYYESL
ncbi:bifunctional 5,10-methylenetetrahydrofolate dehydrogenase/5,10-methenyltetrahydrofolate cyclohydrolase [Sporolactobacillus sp. THM19-2]|uniref:bifunctional 5,10-methylenetetrahydrofolate dehydrogenase/5,10-methenyltetrahydrofolate cyclohydrolase n=1 Tax=Sporolactobacillus sp. THM19-2 TaxID=2511171 RepID=UPI00101EF6B2|nr:bifunctional 5,10-methylenetetrahydrofolate dehydrogenase/5,10-methenyltetrahydrofolate cyclohydrolase [Sporolactobacillus sp. THM19-2]RYL93333.1 bifunctional 5,10-methylenetetrahydrofolate dehydrogenase/5,10-methenyltetrahydrofolate cyclohydrolase [Sporolactobacillus sp. THM19-2]